MIKIIETINISYLLVNFYFWDNALLIFLYWLVSKSKQIGPENDSIISINLNIPALINSLRN